VAGKVGLRHRRAIELSMRQRLRMLAVASAVGVASLAVAGPALARSPERFEFDFREAFTDTEVCAAEPWGFDVEATEHSFGFVEVFTDGNGEFTRAIVHRNLDFTISANGITLQERDQLTIIFTHDGRREIGLWAHIQGPGGVVIIDAGQLVFDSDDAFVYSRGRHPQFFGASFCDALLP
jgi:hypothetical protein